MQTFSYENKFDLHENELVGETHFHKNYFALRLVLTRQTRTRKWAIPEHFFVPLTPPFRPIEAPKHLMNI